MVSSPGLDKAFDIVKRELPSVTIHEYASGTECGDWVVPPSWHVSEGYMEDRAGNRIASIEESNLFVAPYSEPVEGWFTKQEIAKHVRTRPDRPSAFSLEHRHAYNYNLVDWGITLPHNRWTALPDGKFNIKIEVETSDGFMKVAEYYLPGRRPETVCLCAHIDELCNDDLSGCVVGLEVMRALEQQENRQYSYQLLLVPEMLGTLFFVHENIEKVRNTIGMLNLEMLGAGDDWVMKKSLRGNTLLDIALRQGLQTLGLEFQELEFFQGYGNDERVYEWPTIGIPGVSLQRYPFAEYHTSEDTPEILHGEWLEEAFQICMSFVQVLEQNAIPRYKTLLQPWLTKWGLYFDNVLDPETFNKFNNIVLFHVDGMRTILELAQMADLPFDQVRKYLDKFVEKDLVEYVDLPRELFPRNTPDT